MESLEEIPRTPFEKGGNHLSPFGKGRQIALLPFLKGVREGFKSDNGRPHGRILIVDLGLGRDGRAPGSGAGTHTQTGAALTGGVFCNNYV